MHAYTCIYARTHTLVLAFLCLSTTSFFPESWVAWVPAGIIIFWIWLDEPSSSHNISSVDECVIHLGGLNNLCTYWIFNSWCMGWIFISLSACVKLLPTPMTSLEFVSLLFISKLLLSWEFLHLEILHVACADIIYFPLAIKYQYGIFRACMLLQLYVATLHRIQTSVSSSLLPDAILACIRTGIWHKDT